MDKKIFLLGLNTAIRPDDKMTKQTTAFIMNMY